MSHGGRRMNGFLIGFQELLVPIFYFYFVFRHSQCQRDVALPNPPELEGGVGGS